MKYLLVTGNPTSLAISVTTYVIEAETRNKAIAELYRYEFTSCDSLEEVLSSDCKAFVIAITAQTSWDSAMIMFNSYDRDMKIILFAKLDDTYYIDDDSAIVEI